MKVHAVLRRTGVQDAGLAALLVIATALVLAGARAGQQAGTTPVVSASFAEVWPLARWGPVWVCVVAVLVRRRWPIPAFAAASLCVVMAMAVAAGPVPADLAVPIILYTIAAQRRRTVSLALLGVALAVAAAWSVSVGLDGKVDGWRYDGGPAPEVSDFGPTALGPTDWGGVLVLGPPLVVAWAIGWSVRSRRAYLGELRARAGDLERERDQRAALAVAAERARITREVHDVVAHGLAVIVMQAQGGTAAFDKRPADTLAALDTIVATGRASLADLRQVLSSSEPMDDPARPVPGLAQLPRLVDQVRRAGTPVGLRITGSARPLPTGVDVSAYRIVQEALTNTMKHAGPRVRAEVAVSYGRGELTLDISDDGTGGPAAGGTGNGLRGMRERVALLGGEVAAGPGPDGGFVVRARVPLDPGGTA